ncbi:MAG: putative rane protein [Lachnospiraceae bacterium]|jgi:membrane protein implicated in regulation of membrane protease activity|nr:putative rane protein [Anaerocolumna sp.]MDF2609492.1 putative rane protein [Lachnospiraceae bacterium]
MNSIYWLVALAIFLVIEILTLGLTTIWFAGGALSAFLLSLIVDNLMLEVIVFLAASFLLLFFTRPIAAKYFNTQRIKTNYETLLGKDGKVVERIDNFNMTGQVIVSGQEWTARSLRDDEIIEVGQKVRVRNVSGVKLIVEIEKEVL